eukprot:5783442-Amphidinium_carterae.1
MANTCRVFESTAATNVNRYVMGRSVSREPFRNPKSRATRGSSRILSVVLYRAVLRACATRLHAHCAPATE